MCPRPKGWSDEQWKAYQARRRARIDAMMRRTAELMESGLERHVAFRAMEDEIDSGAGWARELWTY